MPDSKTNPAIYFADGWQPSVAKSNMPRILAEEDGRLRLLNGDLKIEHDFGSVGPVDCPIAYDPIRKVAFRYVSPPGFRAGDYSQLRAFSVDRRETYVLKELPLNQWVLWMLEWVGGGASQSGRLFGLVATDRPSDGQVVIEHRLFTHTPAGASLSMRPLCRDAYRPLAFSRRRGELVFGGAEGIYLLNLRGQRKAMLPSEAASSGQGASFAPDGSSLVVLGGDGLHLWDVARNACRRLTRNGRYPVWAPDGQGVYYRESSADLHYYDLATDASTCLLRLGAQSHPEFWHARPVSLSACGRYLATSLTEKILRGVSQKGSATGERERVYQHRYQLCVLDQEARTGWSREGFANHLRWV